jgi:uncharacterized membrane protein YdfJ with MMPL/SSD domain
MGGTIDYAIVLSGRYEELRATMDKKQAMIKSVTASFPTVITSGAIMMVASLLLYFVLDEPMTGTLGLALFRGTLISVICVLSVLPVLLYFCGDFLAKKTKVNFPKLNLKSKYERSRLQMRQRIVSSFAAQDAFEEETAATEANIDEGGIE